MARNKSSISKGKTYREIGEFWDSHDLLNYWDATKEADFKVEIESEKAYYGIERNLSEKIEREARHRRVSGDTLINLWL